MEMARLFSRLIASIVVIATLSTSGMAGDPGDIDMVILDNDQRIVGTLAEDPGDANFVLIKTLSGSRIRRRNLSQC